MQIFEAIRTPLARLLLINIADLTVKNQYEALVKKSGLSLVKKR